MKPPRYTQPSEFHHNNSTTCSQCGALVVDQDVHTSWHAALVRLLGLEDDE